MGINNGDASWKMDFFGKFVSKSRAVKFLLLLLLVSLNFIIRLPSIPHGKGSDSFFIQTLANTINLYGSAEWWLNWLSVFGLYPNSYASAVPFVLSGMSQLADINMETTTLLYCIIIGLFSMFSAYIFAGVIYNNFIFKFIMALFFSIAPGVLLFTTWEASSRGQFIVFFPLFLYVLLHNKFTSLKYVLIPIVLIFVFATHHYAYFLLFISVLYLILATIHKINPGLLLYYMNSIYAKLLYIAAFFAVLIVPFLTRFMINSGSRYSWIIGSLVTNIRQSGLVFAFSFVGLLYLVFKKNSFKELFVLGSVLFLLPTLYSQIYGPFILLLPFIFLASISFANVLRNLPAHRNKFVVIFVILSILSVVAFSGFFNHYRLGSSSSFWYMQESNYEAAIWAKNHIPEGSRGLGNGFETTRFLAVSEGHPILTATDPINFAYGWIHEDNIMPVKNSPRSMAYYFDGPYSVKPGTTFEGSIEWLRYTARSMNDLAGFDYVVNDKNYYNEVVKVVHSDANLIYDCQTTTIWKVPKNV